MQNYKMRKEATGQFASFLAKGAYILAAISLAAAGGAGVAQGYVQNALTRPRKQDKKILQLQHRNNRLRQDIRQSSIALDRINTVQPEEHKKALRVF